MELESGRVLIRSLDSRGLASLVQGNNMHCPRCGSSTESDRKFCRSCGFNLEGLAEMLLARKDENVWQVRRIERGLNFFLGSVVMASIIVLFGVVAHQVMSRLDKLSSTLLLFLIAFALATMFMTYSGVGRKRPEDEGAIEPEALPRGGPTVGLLQGPEHEAMTSVTERTTELLEVKQGDTAGGGQR